MKTIITNGISAPNQKNATVSKSDKITIASPNTTAEINMELSKVEAKRPVSLNLNKAKPMKPLLLIKTAPLAIDSPHTPDLEMLSTTMLQTPQPGVVFPSKGGEFQVTSEQEAFGKGFEEALHSLHNSKSSQPQTNNVSIPTDAVADIATSDCTETCNNNTSTASTVIGMSGGSFTYTNLDGDFSVAIKDEPQNQSASPLLSPIDMEAQEKNKLERKRQRNRIAASKCRKRKLERISKLEDKVKILKGENVDLGQVVKNLKMHVAELKQKVIEHIETGCKIPKINSTQ